MLNAFNEIKDLLLSTAQENAFCWTSDRLPSAIAKGAVGAAKAKFKEDWGQKRIGSTLQNSKICSSAQGGHHSLIQRIYQQIQDLWDPWASSEAKGMKCHGRLANSTLLPTCPLGSFPYVQPPGQAHAALL